MTSDIQQRSQRAHPSSGACVRPSLNRVHAASKILRLRAKSARDRAASQPENSQYAAALRGKAVAYAEAAVIIDALERGQRLQGRRDYDYDYDKSGADR